MNPLKLSKFLSLILRHDPGKIGAQLDPQGWINCMELINAATAHGVPFTREQLEAVVRSSDKQRFAFSPDGSRIRANQGHSVEVALDLRPIAPPRKLFHGTVDLFLDAIRAEGLVKRDRHHVHLSLDLETARKVGARRGKPVLLAIDSAAMAIAGFPFYRSENGVWLTDHVPLEFIDFELKTVTLYRPVGPSELALIEQTGWTDFPPRLPDQPIFYPVTNEGYAIQIARDWNVTASGSGFVTRFEVDARYLARYPVQTVGGREHTEYWIPAEDLAEFNRNILGPIQVTRSYP